MRVFFICNWYPNPANAADGVFLKNTATAIAQSVNVTVFYADSLETIDVPRHEVTGSIPKVCITFYPSPDSNFKLLNLLLRSFRRIKYLKRMLDEEMLHSKPDLLHLNIVSPSVLLVWYYRWRYGIPYVYSEHWDIPLRVKMGLQKKWLPWRVGMKLTAMFSDKTIVCSNAIREAFLKYKLADAQTLAIVPNVVVTGNSPAQDEKQRTDKKILLHVSSLNDHQKNISGILKAVQNVHRSRNDFELHFLGKGPEIEKHKKLAESLDLLNTVVFFHGYVSDEEKLEWYAKSTAHILFSNFEGYSVVTAESIFNGRPVIVTNCGGPSDFVTPETGIMIEPGNIEALAGAIHHMLNHATDYKPDLLRNYGLQTFSQAVVGQKHVEIYQQILHS